METRKRILTGDTPTGRLHLGHWVGSVENRLALQNEYDCYFIIANKHAFTTRADKPQDIRQSVIDIATDYLAVGIDPNKSTLFIQSEVPAIDELTFFLAMLLPFNRVMRNPTLKDEIRDKGLGDEYSFGFPLYAVGQCADILAFRPALVPVGEDQLPHLEMTREVARRFNQTLLRRRSARRRQRPSRPRRSFSDYRTEARPRPPIGRHRRARPGWEPTQDEQIAQQRHFPLGRRRHRAEKSDGNVHRSQAHPRHRSGNGREQSPLDFPRDFQSRQSVGGPSIRKPIAREKWETLSSSKNWSMF